MMIPHGDNRLHRRGSLNHTRTPLDLDTAWHQTLLIHSKRFLEATPLQASRASLGADLLHPPSVDRRSDLPWLVRMPWPVRVPGPF